MLVTTVPWTQQDVVLINVSSVAQETQCRVLVDVDGIPGLYYFTVQLSKKGNYSIFPK
jgi:hypothetical protein